jgi:hypothetical protein
MSSNKLLQYGLLVVAGYLCTTIRIFGKSHESSRATLSFLFSKICEPCILLSMVVNSDFSRVNYKVLGVIVAIFTMVGLGGALVAGCTRPRKKDKMYANKRVAVYILLMSLPSGTSFALPLLESFFQVPNAELEWDVIRTYIALLATVTKMIFLVIGIILLEVADAGTGKKKASAFGILSSTLRSPCIAGVIVGGIIKLLMNVPVPFLVYILELFVGGIGMFGKLFTTGIMFSFGMYLPGIGNVLLEKKDRIGLAVLVVIFRISLIFGVSLAFLPLFEENEKKFILIYSQLPCSSSSVSQAISHGVDVGVVNAIYATSVICAVLAMSVIDDAEEAYEGVARYCCALSMICLLHILAFRKKTSIIQTYSDLTCWIGALLVISSFCKLTINPSFGGIWPEECKANDACFYSWYLQKFSLYLFVSWTIFGNGLKFSWNPFTSPLSYFLLSLFVSLFFVLMEFIAYAHIHLNGMQFVPIGIHFIFFIASVSFTIKLHSIKKKLKEHRKSFTAALPLLSSFENDKISSNRVVSAAKFEGANSSFESFDSVFSETMQKEASVFTFKKIDHNQTGKALQDMLFLAICSVGFCSIVMFFMLSSLIQMSQAFESPVFTFAKLPFVFAQLLYASTGVVLLCLYLLQRRLQLPTCLKAAKAFLLRNTRQNLEESGTSAFENIIRAERSFSRSKSRASKLSSSRFSSARTHEYPKIASVNETAEEDEYQDEN